MKQTYWSEWMEKELTWGCTYRSVEYNLESEISPISKFIFNKCSKIIQWGKIVSSSNGSGTTGYKLEKETHHKQN